MTGVFLSFTSLTWQAFIDYGLLNRVCILIDSPYLDDSFETKVLYYTHCACIMDCSTINKAHVNLCGIFRYRNQAQMLIILIRISHVKSPS